MFATSRRLGSGLALAAVLSSSMSATAQSPDTSPIASIGPQTASPAPVGRIAHPVGATDVVGRMDTGGGFVPLTYGLIQAPEFTLYGDGTVAFRPSLDSDGNGFPPFVQTTMSAAQMDALLAYALGPGGLRDARESYDHRQITDMPTTVFTIDADGVEKSVSVYALGMTQPEGPDAEVYQAFQQLGATLSDFGVVLAQGKYEDVHVYQPTEYRAFMSPVSDPTASASPWPWPELTLDDFEPYGDHEDVLIGGLTAKQDAQVTTIPSGGVVSIVIQAPDGIKKVTLSIRPLLPGEPLDPLAAAS